MTERKEEHPYCFGNLDDVFPLGEDGLRHSPESCMVCFCKTDCLRAAVTGPEGIEVKKEQIKRAHSSGTIGFVERWARKKALEKRKKKRRQD